MTTTQYRTRHIVYTVCLSCGAFAFTPKQLNAHKCTEDWPRFMKNCDCPECRRYREWTAGNQ